MDYYGIIDKTFAVRLTDKAAIKYVYMGMGTVVMCLFY